MRRLVVGGIAIALGTLILASSLFFQPQSAGHTGVTYTTTNTGAYKSGTIAAHVSGPVLALILIAGGLLSVRNELRRRQQTRPFP